MIVLFHSHRLYRRRLGRVLRERGLVVWEAADERTVRDLLSPDSTPPAVLVLDLDAPDERAMRKVVCRAQVCNPRITLIYVTESRSPPARLGGIVCPQKPLRPMVELLALLCAPPGEGG
jgi:hypothetical protein